MRGSFLRRGGTAAMFVAGIGAAVLGFASSASAATTLYDSGTMKVRMFISGGGVNTLNKCLNDAKDGRVQYQNNACDQVSTAGNSLELEHVKATALTTTVPSRILFRGNDVKVKISGGFAKAVNLCVNDAKDGYVKSQVNKCVQSAQAGNLVTITNVLTTIYDR